MNRITINTSKKYDILIGEGLLAQAGIHIRNVKKAKKAVIISDTNVFPLYGQIVSDSMTSVGIEVVSFVFTAGEQSKSFQTYYEIVNFFAKNELTRGDIAIALGGGVVGDITGFASATYLRGIEYIQIPTTLLAMVDSSVGGKTAIDLPAGKNLVGAFYQPSMVICDLLALQTLPKSVFCDGCAEVIKYAVLFDSDLFNHLMLHGLDFNKQDVIYRCICLKRDVVTNDEYDHGCRQLLNLGHTIGHGIEKCSNYTITHGQAVAAGMAIVAKAATDFHMCDENVHPRICQILKKFTLPFSCVFSVEEIYDSVLSDKKRNGDTVNLIIPRHIGKCIISPTPLEKIKSFIKAGL